MDVKSVVLEACLNFLGNITTMHEDTGLNMHWYYAELHKLVSNVICNHSGRCSRKEETSVGLQISSSVSFSKLTAFRHVTKVMCSSEICKGKW
jgi:hypothetical protein